MDLLEKLSQDHRDVEHMFHEFHSEPSEELAVQIHNALKAHMDLEEKSLYPKIAKFDKEAAEHAEEEHDHGEELADQLKADYGNFGLFQQLKNAISHHVTNEEEPGGLFDKCRENLSEKDLSYKAE